MSEYILETFGLTKQYGSFTAVRDVNLHVEKKDIYGFVGKNGAGKSTCMKMISGLSHPTAGQISMFGCRGSEKELNQKGAFARVGALIESPAFYPNLSGYDNVELIAKGIGGVTKKDIDETLEIVGLTQAAKRKTKGYSFGMKQRLGIGIALLTHPEFLILDEPINGLDPQGIAEIRELVHRLVDEKNVSVMISSHILGELEKIAKRIGIIHKGKLLCEFNKEDFLREHNGSIVLETPDAKKAIDYVREQPGSGYVVNEERQIIISNCQLPMGSLIRELVLRDVYIHRITEKQLSLEQYYFELTNG
ncbi:MAG: ABC transporter ATP-binding protein [Lachnospiraceae bacterium]|nr:ABC transporter ATP-binding protein [Lachnospiraceae bacterium]